MSWFFLSLWLIVIVGGGLVVLRSLISFRRTTHSIDSADDLRRLKQVAGFSMRVSLLRTIVAVICLIYFLLGMQLPTVTPAQSVCFQLAASLTIAVIISLIFVRRSLMRIPVGDPTIASEHALVLDVWKRRFFAPW
jgi:hypothetical protein